MMTKNKVKTSFLLSTCINEDDNKLPYTQHNCNQATVREYKFIGIVIYE